MAPLQFRKPGLLILTRRTGGVTGGLRMDMRGLNCGSPIPSFESQRGSWVGISPARHHRHLLSPYRSIPATTHRSTAASIDWVITVAAQIEDLDIVIGQRLQMRTLFLCAQIVRV